MASDFDRAHDEHCRAMEAANGTAKRLAVAEQIAATYVADLAQVAARAEKAEASIRTRDAEIVAWRSAWDGREEAEHAIHAYADPGHQHDVEGQWDDEDGPCESCQRFIAVRTARAANGPIGGVA